MTFALKVLTPVTPLLVAYTDFTSEIPCSVTAMAILPLSKPLKERASLGTKVPFVSYTVTAVPAETPYLKNPVAPLDLPFTKVGVFKVCAWLRDNSVVV